MANENFYVRHFDNIFVIDPNKVINSQGFPEDRNVLQENLVMYANLECNQQPRSRLISGENKQTLENIAIASVNFLKPNGQDYLSTKWTDLQSEGADPNIINSELLGITNITYKCGASYVPTVNITLEDVRGRALFESGNNSVYSVFVNLPYPTFYLTLKGYYGKAVRYTLILQKFQASFDQSSGNFISTLNFVGYKYNILTDVRLGFLLGTPYMYSQQTNTNVQTEPGSVEQASVDQLNGNNADISSIIEKVGYKTIQSVYEIYKSKKIVPQNFPPLTIDQLISRLQNFEKNILESYGEMDVSKLTDAENFDTLLSDFLVEVYTATTPKSWFKEYLDEEKYYYTIGSDGKPYKIYTYKKTIVEKNDYDTVLKKLKAFIKKHNTILSEATTFGEKVGKKEDVIPVNIKESSVIPESYILANLGEIDLVETTKARFGKQYPTSSEFQVIRLEIQKLNNLKNSVEQARNENENIPIDEKQIPFFFRFDGEGFFREEILKLKKILSLKVKTIEENLSAELLNLLSSDKGIGFEPNIRNVLAVILASTDAFLRLLENVHKKAFDARNDIKKKNSSPQDVKNDPDSPVYPWPLYVKEIPVDGETKYELKYPGDPDYIFETGAFDYNVWPEVEFVEEFQKGYLERTQDVLNSPPQANELTTINRLLISAFDTSSNISYSDLQTEKFLIEIYDRIRTISMYQGFVRNKKYETITNFIEAFEASNIKIGLGGNGQDIINIIKNFGFNQPGAIGLYENYLNEIAPKTFFSTSAGSISTPYLLTEIDTSSKFLESELPEVVASIATENNANEVEQTMVKYLQSSETNSLVFTDIYPFCIPDWNKTNLNKGEQNFETNKVLNTTKSLFYNTKTKKILNYQSNYTLDNRGENNKNRPFNFFVNTGAQIDYNQISQTQDTLNYLKNRAIKKDAEKKSIFTEGKISNYDPETGLGWDGLIPEKTASMLNTTMFIKAIQNGVAAEKTNSGNPYLQASFLFLNSLPLSNTKRQYIDSNGNTRDYIGPTFNKFGAVHSVPKMWVCKIGSIWYRYKNFLQSGNDFLDSSLGQFDANFNYDPNFSQSQTEYNFTSQTTNFSIILQDVKTVPQSPSPVYNDLVNVGFYPNLLNDFYYFYNGENLYSENTTIEKDIQDKINKKDIILLTNGNSYFFKPIGYDPERPGHYLNYQTFSVLFKKTLKENIDDPSIYYYSGPSFGSRYTQVLSECFNQNTLVHPVYNNPSVFNGSVRLLWGGPHFGYFPNINYIGSPDEYFSNTSKNDWPFDFKLDSLGNNSIGEKIEDLFGVFTKEELDLFENEFLNFSKSAQQSTSDFNLQSILRKSLFVEKGAFENSDHNLMIENFQKNQLFNFNGSINKYINLNTIYQKGNPTNFNYQIFSYFTKNPLPGVTDGVDKYTEITPKSLPTSALTITLSESQTTYPEAWEALKLNVGFSTIESAKYADSGCTITDFFVDNNIAFTVVNIEKFSNLIKIYTTKKILNPNYNNTSFVTDVTKHISETLELRDIIFQGVFSKLERVLTTSTNQSENVDPSQTQGWMTKLEYYGLFKSLNDKWIAGNNYADETMFEDILLLDRAGRDIGSKVIVDIFSVVNWLKEPKNSVYVIVNSILTTNHFVVYNMPSYINYYGCQNVDDNPQPKNDNDFANSLFGLYTEVDYQNSKTKMVCQYSEQPSEQPSNPNIKNGYKDDTWDMEQAPNNPCVEGKQNKDDFGKSNKAVSFNVDFGLQNQGVFTNVQVGQDMGKPTSESLQMEYELANLSKGTNTATQNVSLINLYKTRSYTSTVTAMGNAMIQPTMYFILRNIPLFGGPYLITEVSHTITSNDFKTTMVGTRQKIYTPPIQNPLIETIRKTFLNRLKNQYKTKKQSQKIETNTIQTKNRLANTISNKETPSPNQICKVNNKYFDYINTTPKETTTSTKDMLTTVKKRIRELNFGSNSGDSMNFVVTTLFYIESFDGQSFKYFNNNPSQIPIGSGTTVWGGNLSSLFSNEYICLNDTQNISQAYAVFPSLENCIDFTHSKYKVTFQKPLTTLTNEDEYVSNFARVWIEMVPQDNVSATSNIYDNFVNSYPDQFEKLQDKIRACYKLVLNDLNNG